MRNQTVDLAELRGLTYAFRLPFGTVAGYLLRSSPIPILAIPSHARTVEERRLDAAAPVVRTILVLSRGEKSTEGIVPVAVEFAISFGADLAILLHIVPPWTTGRGEAEIRVEAEHHLATLARAFESEQIRQAAGVGAHTPISRAGAGPCR